MNQQQRAVVQFPRHTSVIYGDWTIDPAFLLRVQHTIAPDTPAEFTPSMKEIETTLLALEVIPSSIYTFEPEPVQEPVAWVKQIPDAFPMFDDDGLNEEEHHYEWALQHEAEAFPTSYIPTTPPTQPAVPLTDEQIDYSIKKGDIVTSKYWSLTELIMVDVNWALGAVAVQLGEGGGVVVWPTASIKKAAHGGDAAPTQGETK
jgi:hypothetical protein